jgi:hypothetical protein
MICFNFLQLSSYFLQDTYQKPPKSCLKMSYFQIKKKMDTNYALNNSQNAHCSASIPYNSTSARLKTRTLCFHCLSLKRRSGGSKNAPRACVRKKFACRRSPFLAVDESRPRRRVVPRANRYSPRM